MSEKRNPFAPQPGQIELPRPTRMEEPDRAALVRFRLKGQTDGPIYQGQELKVPCRGCGGRFDTPGKA